VGKKEGISLTLLLKERGGETLKETHRAPLCDQKKVGMIFEKKPIQRKER